MSNPQWEIEFTSQFEGWWHTLSVDEQRHVTHAVALLTNPDPGLGRPLVDTISISRHTNLKELRAGTTRTLFAFDPRRTAILLLGGDKSGIWNLWYERSIPLADDIYDEHLKALDDQGTTKWQRSSMN